VRQVHTPGWNAEQWLWGDVISSSASVQIEIARRWFPLPCRAILEEFFHFFHGHVAQGVQSQAFLTFYSTPGARQILHLLASSPSSPLHPTSLSPSPFPPCPFPQTRHKIPVFFEFYVILHTPTNNIQIVPNPSLFVIRQF